MVLFNNEWMNGNFGSTTISSHFLNEKGSEESKEILNYESNIWFREIGQEIIQEDMRYEKCTEICCCGFS